MKMTRCPEKHIYDADKYETCPYCSGEIRAAESGRAPKKAKIVKVRAVKANHISDIEEKPAAAKPEVKPEQKLQLPEKEKSSDNKMPEITKKENKSDDKKPEAPKKDAKAEEKKPEAPKKDAKAEEKKPEA
ncbi:hypothetical protein, partial [uncultured Ruminococcus sp.]|uniref:hypothetical protein n=1 Tax=uncultured Ruminococcus sp. TaxID=165186 RepID=UPI00344CE4B2